MVFTLALTCFLSLGERTYIRPSPENSCHLFATPKRSEVGCLKERWTETGWQNKVASVKQDGSQDMHLVFFKYRFLNALRDEVGLTLYREKVTLLHLLCLLIPVAGVGFGWAWSAKTHDLLREIIGVLIGLVIGIAVSWPLPKLLWKTLCLFARKGWFLQLQKQETEKIVPAMTSDEFIAKSKAFNREDMWPIPAKKPFFPNAVFFLVAVSFALGFMRLCGYMDSSKPPDWIQVLVGMGIIAFVVGCTCLFIWLKKRLWRRHGLLCPNCGNKITDAAGLIRVPYMGLCKHCGAKIVEIKTKTPIPG